MNYKGDDADTVIGKLDFDSAADRAGKASIIRRLIKRLRAPEAPQLNQQVSEVQVPIAETNRQKETEETIKEGLEQAGYQTFTFDSNIKTFSIGRRRKHEGQVNPTIIIDNIDFSRGPNVIVTRLDSGEWQLTQNGTQNLVYRRTENDRYSTLSPGMTVKIGSGSVLGTRTGDNILKKIIFYPIDYELVVGISGQTWSQ